MIQDLIARNRSYRRFDGKVVIGEETLRGLVDLARLSASSANRQPLKYILSNTAARNDLIFPCLAWAGYLPEWKGPTEAERPSGYVVVLGDTEISGNFGVDPGIALQSMLLGAVEQGLGGCIIASIKKEKLRDALSIPERYEILYVLALGKPAETVQVEALGADGDIKYWRTADEVHHVPKRALKELLLDI